MSGELIVFVLCAFVGLLTAVATIAVRNPIRAAMALLAHVIVAAVLYVTLNAHLLAALQVIVYAGAIVVLFIFVIMLIGPTPGVDGPSRNLIPKTLSTALMAMFGLTLAFALLGHQPLRMAIPGCAPGTGPECHQFGGVRAFAQELYVLGVVPFELISILLMVAIVGAIAVARSRTAKDKELLRLRQKEDSASPALNVTTRPGGR